VTRSRPKLRTGFILAKPFTLSAFASFVDTLRLASDTPDKSGRLLAEAGDACAIAQNLAAEDHASS